MRDTQRRRRSVLESLLEWECTPSSGDMTLPVSSYEELLARVRSLTHETIQLQRELTTPLIDHNENERPLTTSCCDAISTCDNKKRGVASVGWTTPAGGTQHQAGPPSGDGSLHRPPGSSIHRRSVSNPAEVGAPGPTGAAGWSRRGAHRPHGDTLHFQNGGIGNEELSAASVLARLGVTVDARGSLVRDKSAALLSGRIAVSNKENVMDEPKEEDEKKTAELCRTKNNDDSLSELDGAGGDSKMTSSATQTRQETQNLSALYRGTWPVERSLWHSGPSSIGGTGSSKSITQDVPSVVSFTSSMSSASGCLPTDEVAAARRTYSQQQLGAKVEMVYSLLSMLGTHDREDMSRTLLAMSSSADSCVAMRQSGCLPLLVQLLHAPDSDADTRQRAAQVLHNMVHSHPDDKRSRREARVLRLLEQVREYCDSLRDMIRAAAAAEGGHKAVEDDMERHPGPTIAALMKLSFDEEHRHAMCQLGGLHAVAELIQVDHEAHGSTTSDQYCVTLRRYAGMALTNLTFGDGANKALLCSFRQFMKALVAQLKSPSEDLRQVTASVLRNLSWRADGASKQTLREVGAVSGLMQAAMEGRKESTLKSILSALWNLSAHCSINKVDICAVEGALGFLVDMLSYKAPSKTLAIVENAGGILRNISSHIAVREDYRAILREHNCLQVLLQQLKSPSLTVVSNACGTLWNLSARCAEDQRALWDMGAVSMLRSLVHSKHKMISMGSSAALKNLLSAKPNNNFPPLDSTAKGLGLPALPSLYARKQRALEQELDQTLSETCDNIEPSTSPSASTIGLRDEKFVFSTTERCFGSAERRQSRMCHSYQHHPPSSRYHSKGVVARSDSRDSVTSTLSDTVYERVSRTVINPFTYGQALPASGMSQGLTGSLSDSGRINSQMSGGENSDQRFLRRYCNSMKEREENRNAEPLNLSIEDNTQHSVLQHSHELYQHTRLGQISEAKHSDPTESQNNIVDLSQETHVRSHQPATRNEIDAKFSDKIEECDERVSSAVQSDTGSGKRPKNLFYDSMRSPHQRSAFGPVVAGSYGQSSNKPQYQHLTQQQSCVTSSHTAVRTKYSDFAYDDDTETQEQPVDYSLKYVEGSAPHGDIDVATTESSNIKTGSDQEEGDPEGYQTSRNSSNIRGKQNQNDLGRGYPYRHPGSIHVNKNMKLKVVYGDYAETDLDQPTDYSLKYAEENEEIEFDKNHEISSREEERPERNYYDGADAIHEDTLKTYCTEGTPYETPYNFSNATSMSDLHCEPPTPVSEESGGKKQAENYCKDGSIEDNAIRSVDENETSNSEGVSNFDKDFTEKGPQMKALPPAPRQPLKRLQSGLSSGLLSPEKPVQYCVEGTPGSFSRVSSLSSLSSVPANVDNTLQAPAANTDHSVSEPDQKPQKDDASSLAESGDKAVVERENGNSGDTGEDTAGHTEDMKEEQHRVEREGKVVTFGGADLYAEETPLMFSRCSSLCSLSSIEQHSIHDDRSSVISDFSRRTSGIVSPSELPDSPTQTVPTSPRHTRPPVEFTSRLMEQRAQPVTANTHHAEISNTVKGSVFEDRLVAFKEEDTPVEFSRATSLSSLTIDDEPKISNDAMLKEVVGKPSSYTRSSNIPTGIHHAGRLELVGRDREEGMEKQDVEKEKRGELADCCELAPVSEGEEENDEDMLAACINIGMQNSRQRQCQYSIENATKNVPATTHQPTGVARLQTSRAQSHMLRSGRPSGIPVKTAPNNSLRQGKVNQPAQHEGVGEGTSKSLNNMVVMLCNLVGTSDHPIQVPGGTCCEDAVRTFCDEGTPANISHTGSHSDLSVLSLPGDRDETEAQKEDTHLEGVNRGEESVGSGDREAERPELSDDSSNFSGDNDNILAECIQSGMPKAHQTSRRILAQPGSMNIASSSAVPSQQKKKIPTVVPGVTVSVLPPQQPSATTYRPPTHHLCGLSHSSPHPINKKPSPLSCSPQPKATDQHMPRHKPTVKNDTGATQTTRAPKAKLSGILQGPNMLPQCLAAKDEVEVYAFEGSPNECCDGCALCLQRFSSGDALPKTAAPDISLGFSTENTPLEVSHAASLSSLNVDDDDDDEFNTVMKEVQPSTSGPHNIGPSQSSEVPISITYSSEPGPRSCVSPLNKSVDSVTAEATAHVMVGSDSSWGEHSDKHDDSTSSKLLNKTSSVSEDVVTVLSRNDSLSSLSVDSFGSTEPTPSEQALLEQCISSGMPKSKSEGGCGKARIVVPVSTKKKISGGVCKIPLAIGDRRQGDGERSGPVIPGVPLQKLELKPVARIHCESGVAVAGAAGNDIPSLNLQNDVHTCAYDRGQIPKNGVDASAALGLKEMAAGVDGSIAAITSVQNLQDHPGNSSDLPQNVRITGTESVCVSAARLASETVSTDTVLDVADYEKQRLKESINHVCAQSKENENDDVCRKLTEPENRLDMKLEVSKRVSGVCCLSNKVDSPHGSISDDNKSPLSSGESPSPDFGGDEKVEECSRKRKDPDVMIGSLDHLTEELVQQAQGVHVQKDKNKDCSIMKQSDTWNEDTSPNDVSFPSMSTSAPLIASFKSEDGAVTLPELIKEDDSTDRIGEERQGSSLTDSHMIEVEAGKLAVAVQAEGQNLPYPSAEEMEQSLTSINSVDLDAIKPPSMMGSLLSLTASLSGQLDNVESAETREHHNSSSLPPHQPRNNGTRLECRHSRKKSLPAGMMVRRALGNSNHNGSIENLQDNTSVSSSCNSHLDNIKPPSAMEELIDIVDMENSMVSVASITSEVADSSTKEQSTSEQSPGNSDSIFELIKPAASIMAEVYVAAMSTSVRTSSASDCLDNINPPSAFNEVADLADPESIIEPGTETICSDTEMCTEEPGCAHSMEKLDEIDAPHFVSDTSRKATPSDHYVSSSAESTPKKHGQLTPKQKRQLAKERYKTYTITAEEEISIKKSVDNTRVVPPQPEISFQVLEAETCGSPRSPENLEHTVQEEEKEKGHSKVTPKQRRLEDRQRFQTRVLDKSPSVDVEHGLGAVEQECAAETEGEPCPEEHTKAIHTDTAKQKTSRIKTLKQRRAEAKERFQTHTLSEESRPQHNCSASDNDGQNQTSDGTETCDPNCSNIGFVEALLRVRPDEIESLLEHDANIVITTINDSRRRNSESSELPSSDEMLLECETLSLISIESESEQNSNICRYGKRRGSDLLIRESSVTEESGMSNTEQVFVEEKVNGEIEADTEDRESVADSETSQEDGNNDDLPKTRGPRIVKPEERLKQEESADSNCTDDGAPQNNSPKSIRGRRKALYSSPVAKKATVPPVAGKVRSSIPVVSGAASNVILTKASVIRQNGRGTPQWCVSKTPPSSTEGRLPRNTSPKSNRSGRKQQLNPSSASAPAKTSSSSRNTAITQTSGKDSNERDVKDPRFKPPERQGTFTKDEPNSVVPTAMPPLSPTKTRIPVPASVSTCSAKLESKPKKTCGAIKQSHSVNSTTSKIKIYKERSAPTLTRSLGQSRFTKNCSNDFSTSGKGSPSGNPKSLTKAATIPGRNGTTRSPPGPRVRYKRDSIGAQEGLKTSLSNQSLQSNDSGKTVLKQGTVQPQRSNSNSSLNSVASGGGSSSRRTAGTKKEVTSKIASLWKRVEESKSKQKAAKKDTRVWITATQAENGSDVNIISSDILSAPRLVRSSTFEGLPSMSTNIDVVDQDTKMRTETAKASKTKTEIRCSSHPGKCESTGSCKSEAFTGTVANQESSNIPRQVAEVAGMVIVQPAGKVLGASGCCLSKDRDEVPSQEVVRRKQHNGSGNKGQDSETPKRLSRLGSFIRIDSPEEEVIGNRESKSVSRTPASAIVQPFNYVPPTSTAGSHIPTPVTSTAKRSESYLGGLGNLEQVRCDQAEVIDEHMSEFNTVSMRVTTV